MDSLAPWQGESPHLSLPSGGEEAEPPPSTLNTYSMSRGMVWRQGGLSRSQVRGQARYCEQAGPANLPQEIRQAI